MYVDATYVDASRVETSFAVLTFIFVSMFSTNGAYFISIIFIDMRVSVIIVIV